MFRFVVCIIVSLTGVSWASAETIDVKYYGKLDLGPSPAPMFHGAASLTAHAMTSLSNSWSCN